MDKHNVIAIVENELDNADIIQVAYAALHGVFMDKEHHTEVQTPLGIALDALRETFIWETHGTMRSDENVDELK